jgi:aspartate/methionine/tyrosine aminotransferase
MSKQQKIAYKHVRDDFPEPYKSHHYILPGFSKTMESGMLYATKRAQKKGYVSGDPTWANFGQGAPEVGPIPDAPQRNEKLIIEESWNEYAPVAGLKELREKIAALYNRRYRQEKKSQYTYENVCITPGGRAGLSLVAAAIGKEANVGYSLPDFQPYEDLLSSFGDIVAIPEATESREHYEMTNEKIRKEIISRCLAVLVKSNPCNPTGRVIEGEDLKQRVEIAREVGCTMVMDEFYSHYLYSSSSSQGKTLSSAEYIEDVDKDPIIIIDGLTKGWRLPGWRVCWIIGPKPLIESLTSAESFLEGGTPHPLQHAALPLLDYDFAQKDVIALQNHFKKKRDYMLDRLKKLKGMNVEYEPQGTFYIWINVSELPKPIDDGVTLMEELLDEKVVVVPGIFFDVNPIKRHYLEHSPYEKYVRFSFGPPMAQLEMGMDAVERLLNKYTKTTA